MTSFNIHKLTSRHNQEIPTNHHNSKTFNPSKHHWHTLEHGYIVIIITEYM